MHLELTYRAHSKPEKEKKIKPKVLISLSMFGLSGYADSNNISDPEDKMLLIEYCFFIHKAIVFY